VLPDTTLSFGSGTREYILADGGEVYIWSRHGLTQCATRPPEDVSFVRWIEDGITVHQDAAIVAPETWVIELRHLPHRHLVATWNETAPGARPALPGI
jgi:hypothetical protein